MEFRFRSVDRKPSTHIPPPSTSNVSYFTEQALRVGYSGPSFGSTTEYCTNPNPMHEVVQRELEKDRIREEIIAAEIVRRRVLEEEVRREMMVERQMALRRGGSGFSTFSGFEPRLPVFHQSEGSSKSLEERIILALEERMSSGRPHGGIGAFETMPFQHSAELKITEVKPPSEVSKEKVIFLAKPEGNTSGAKRKAVTPPAAGDTEAPAVGSKKKHKEEWSCAICQVIATSERGLNEHLQGKKHKSKEAALRAQKAGKNYTIGLFPKKTAKPTKVGEPTSNRNLEQLEKSNAEDLKPNNDLALVVFQDTSDSKNKNGDDLAKMREKDRVLKKKRSKFWCEMCYVGAFSEKVMNKHKKGKKHAGRLQRLEKKSGSEVSGKVSKPELGPESEEETPENENVDNGYMDGAADRELWKKARSD